MSTLREITIQCYERFGFIVIIDLDSTLREIHIQHYERFGFIVIIDLVFESHTPAVYFYRRYELTNLSTFLFTTFPIGHKHPPSIFTLHDFVAAFAGLFLRRLCDLPIFIRLDSLLREISVSTLRDI